MFSSLVRHSATKLRPSSLTRGGVPPAPLALALTRSVVIPPYSPPSTSSSSTSSVTLQTLPAELTEGTEADGSITKLPWAKNRIEESLALSCLHPHRHVRDAFIRHLRTSRVVLPANADTLSEAKRLGQFVFMVFKSGNVFQFPVFTSKRRWREFANPQWTSSVTMDVENIVGELTRHFRSGGAHLGKHSHKKMDVRLVVNPTSFYSDSIGLDELTRVLPASSATATTVPKKLKAKSSGSRRKSKKYEAIKKDEEAAASEVVPKTEGEPVDV